MNKDDKFVKLLGNHRVQKNVPLAPYTTFKIGGPAQYFFVARNQKDIILAIKAANNSQLPFTILGGGTNVLISDNGVKGLVIKNESKGIVVIARAGKVKARNSIMDRAVIEVDSGVLINHLVRYTIEEELSGLELFLGQPGTVGGAVYINAHNMNKGVFFGDFIKEAKLVTKEGIIRQVSGEYFQFGYDQSIIQKTGEVVISVKLNLSYGKKERLWQKAKESINYRKLTQPQGSFSSGCMFRNIKKAEATKLRTPNSTCSVGYLLDRVGLKGYRIGGAKFSEKHANFILNVDNASSKDVKSLISLAKKRVKEKFGVILKEEVVLLT